ncbi:MAG: homocysteine S-methyltransferase family protein [Eubacteriales bacterium]|nr:homocysteine S-methyltransferase family protein [Eubacteriales bacterium]
MTREEFAALSQETILLDGATGSMLMEAGMPRGICTEHWVFSHKEVLHQIQEAYIQAGSRIICAPTFGANRISLSMHGLEDQIGILNKTLAAYAKETAQGRAFVAGDMTTSGKMMAPAGDLTYEKAYDMYCEQISLLAQGGVDLILAETMINIEEALAAVDACQNTCDLPILCTMTVDADGSIFSGGNALEAAVSLEAAGASAVGVNCSVGPDQLVSVIRTIREAVSIPVVAKPNAGMPFIDSQGRAVYDMTPQDFARHMKVLTQQGASIIGGCCGTTPAFIKAVADLLEL